MEVLSEHLCQGWLEGYLLTGRHGLFNCYEAFIHIIDSMFNQHAKWLKTTRDIPWRRPVASLNYLLSSLVWRQDHNGFSHQDPGFIDHVVNKKAEVIRVYLPPDANTPAVGGRPLPAVQALRERDRGGQAAAGAVADDGRGDHPLHPRRGHLGVGVVGQRPGRPAGRGAWPAAATRRRWRPWPRCRCCASTCRQLKVRVVNVVDLMRLQPESEHPHGMSDAEFDALFTTDRAGDLRLPRLPVADPPADLPAARSRQLPRPRVQGGGHHHHAVRHGDAQRPGPVPPGDGRDRPGARAGGHGRARAAADGGQADRLPRVHQGVRRGRPGDHGTGRGAASQTHRTARLRRSVVNAGSSSLKLRVLRRRDDGDRRRRPARARRGGRRTAPAIKAAIESFGRGRRGRPPGGARRHAVRRAGARRRRGAAAARVADRPRAAAPAQVARRARRGVSAVLPGVPAVACFDTAFHATIPDGGGDVRAARRVAGPLDAAQVRVPRPVPRLRLAAGGANSPARAPARRTGCASSPATWARARRSPPCTAAGRWTPPWASPRSTAW